MSVTRRGVLAVICLSLSTSVTFAEELDRLDEGTAQAYALRLVEQFSGTKDLQINIPVDPDKAIGLALGREGIILVPSKGLKKGEEPDPAVETEQGAGIAYLFMSPRFNPIIDGKPIPQEKLRAVKYQGDGGEKLATCLILSVRHVEGDDWRLYAYGAGKEPVVDAKFEEVAEPIDEVVQIATKDAGEDEATFVLTVFEKYSANFKIGLKLD